MKLIDSITINYLREHLDEFSALKIESEPNEIMLRSAEENHFKLNAEVIVDEIQLIKAYDDSYLVEISYIDNNDTVCCMKLLIPVKLLTI